MEVKSSAYSKYHSETSRGSGGQGKTRSEKKQKNHGMLYTSYNGIILL